jgi:predicted transcriptional regulator
MEVHFTPEQEAQLSQIASHAGTDTERLVKDAALRLLEQDARFRAAVRAGIAQADRGELKRKRWKHASSGCLTPDAYSLDTHSRSGLARHLRLPKEHEPHLARPTRSPVRDEEDPWTFNEIAPNHDSSTAGSSRART